ncbi:MAG TPA: hypothetical protein VFD92_04845 [Candidatus Binatia bacterium]|nr:hypothetical protein [Candidatus Binatia bacterium]
MTPDPAAAQLEGVDALHREAIGLLEHALRDARAAYRGPKVCEYGYEAFYVDWAMSDTAEALRKLAALQQAIDPQAIRPSLYERALMWLRVRP